MKSVVMIMLLALWSVSAQAHKPSDSYLALTVQNQQVTGRWDIALRDLDYALGLDVNDDGKITWGELQQRRGAINAYALSRLTVTGQKQMCPLQPNDLLVDEHSDGRYAVLEFQANCLSKPENLAIGYQLFFDLDPQHRGLLRLTRGTRIDSAIFSPANKQLIFTEAEARNTWSELLDFGYEGIWHIWIGYDHILFLISLLLPAAMVREGKGWKAAAGFASVFWDVFKVVGAFTLAHSITLSLAVFGYVALPSRWVESAIAASVAIAALNNIFPVFSNRRTLIAFSFGLIHGLGIASVLIDIGLPDSQRLLSLAGFNLGVEMGQLAIVGVVLPLIALLSQYRFYPNLVIKTGSVGIIMVALVWLAERSLDFQISVF